MKKKVFLFPGQGSQYVGMGKNICKEYSVAQRTFEEANEILSFDLQGLCTSGDIKELTQTENAQPAILVAGVAMYKALNEHMELKPNFMAGHSLGEITALTCAGAIDFADAVKIVRKRGLLMRDAVAEGISAMTAVSKINKSIIEEECKKVSREGYIVCVSNYNSEKQNVISGHKDAVKEVEKRLALLGATVNPLNVSAPFHCSLMIGAANQMREELSKYTFHDLKYPVISNVSATPYTGKEAIIDNLVEQIVQPVQWSNTMKYLKEQKVKVAVDIGPGKVLRNLMLSQVPTINSLAYDVEDDAIILSHIAKNEYKLPFLSRSLGMAVAAKNSNWDESAYQTGVVAPYKKIQQLQGVIELEGREAAKEEMNMAIDMLISVFETKKISKEEQKERFKQLFIDTDTEALFRVFDLDKNNIHIS